MNNLKKYRKQTNLSQLELSEKIGFKNRSYISQCELGICKLSLDTANKIAKVLNCNVYDLMGNDLIKGNIPEEDKNKAISALTNNKNSSFLDSFIALINSYNDEFITDQLKDKDSQLFKICNILKTYNDIISIEDLKNIFQLETNY